MDNVSSNLFPEVEPILWARILMFVFSPYGENRIKSFIERSWNFGLIGRITMYSDNLEDNEEESQNKMWEKLHTDERAERKKTFELACFLFRKDFSKEKLEEYLKALEGLKDKYNEDSNEYRKRLRLHNIFSEMLEFVNEQD